MNHRSLQYILNCHTHHTPSRRMDGADRFYLCFHQDNAPSGLGASAGPIIYYHILWRSGHEAHRTSSYIMEIGARGSGARGSGLGGRDPNMRMYEHRILSYIMEIGNWRCFSISQE